MNAAVLPPDRMGALRIAELSPANFAIVMAVGILGVDCRQQGHERFGQAMLALAFVAWAVVAALGIAKAVRHPSHVLADLRSHARAPGFLTLVAGTSILGSLWLSLGLPPQAGAWLGGLAAVLWVAVTYGVLIVLTLESDKPPLAEAISGTWLLIVVATQSIAIVAVLVGAGLAPPARLALNFAATAMWLCGGMLYVWVIALIFYRCAFFRMSPRDLAPTYWINMGAMAISALAGALLVVHTAGAPFLAGLLPLLRGGTVLYWAVGTWWIPFMAALTAWRAWRDRQSLRYEVGYWGIVFPLGMYSAATHEMAAALELDFLQPVARAFFLLALAVGMLTAAGLLRRVVRPRLQPRA
ncbi:tellurite resistance/C4-dicarboxylate transporter family protein [Ramlibacter humi]|uniref:C4-dicarboxylate ABC transporter n=1 Tax=Ramlibacter humi TaxID=2530451 RepID=A0A4Z0BEV6_9BURK|nr:tellurite resistance/C4-dicarboxylate transporter family protein [Ramlibacter humi]TFY97211.1 C4-dicarboxylate ABC transporter [Ramlibacter humi]